MPDVSVIIPVYNVERYLRKCLDSVAGQTLRDIQIICVNDGSTDASPSILREYADRDPRFVVVDKPNGGYGQTMNRGFDLAEGKYIGIVESDDFIKPEMFEILFREAEKTRADVVKGGFLYYWSAPSEKTVKETVGSIRMCRRAFSPLEDLGTDLEKAEFFNIKSTIWSAIYRTDFIRENRIRFLETPGASYQDTGFNFKVFACAKRVKLVRDCLLYYRQDNESSSVNSPGKVFCICDEYAEIARFLQGRKDLRMPETVKNRVKFDNYMWNYSRLAEPFRKEFLERISREFREDLEKGQVDPKLYPGKKWESFLAAAEGKPGGTGGAEGKTSDRNRGVTAAWLKVYLKQRGPAQAVRKLIGKLK